MGGTKPPKKSSLSAGWHRALDLARKALANGGQRLSITRVKWDISGDCELPYTREVCGRPTERGRRSYVWNDGMPIPYEVELHTRCHKCRTCLKARASLWRMRGEAEFDLATRAWFGTLTFRPERRYYYETKARYRASKSSVDFDALDPEKKFGRVHDEAKRAVTLWLKRVRFESGARIRYLLVAEAHKDGFPHFHILVFEHGVEVPYRLLTRQWTEGFSKFNLAEDKKAVAYCCKYLTKSQLAKVRASVRFGAATSLGTPQASPGVAAPSP